MGILLETVGNGHPPEEALNLVLESADEEPEEVLAEMRGELERAASALEREPHLLKESPDLRQRVASLRECLARRAPSPPASPQGRTPASSPSILGLLGSRLGRSWLTPREGGRARKPASPAVGPGPRNAPPPSLSRAGDAAPEPPTSAVTSPAERLVVKSLATLGHHITTGQRLSEDDAKHAEGSMGYLRSNEARFLVYMARCFDRLRVKLCKGLVGRALYDGLRKGSDSHRLRFLELDCPIVFSNRHCYAAAACAWGGKGRHPYAQVVAGRGGLSPHGQGDLRGAHSSP